MPLIAGFASFDADDPLYLRESEKETRRKEEAAMVLARSTLVKIAARSQDSDIIALAIKAMEDICALLGDEP